MRTITYRREQNKKRKRRARRIISRWFHGRDLADDERFVGIMAATPCRCSCPYCGNERRHFGKRTRQEIVADIITNEQLEVI